ncbi:MAG TPA: hypothetical protein ENN29_03245 [Candidatus Hydrogenedentes bacterium]|nr:hypothetical protein [Candidatus Hydrogenedentota bacterium]
MDNATVKNAVNSVALEKEGAISLSCSDAFQIAKKYGLNLKDISRYCNQNNIKIVKCQLGCF